VNFSGDASTLNPSEKSPKIGGHFSQQTSSQSSCVVTELRDELLFDCSIFDEKEFTFSFDAVIISDIRKGDIIECLFAGYLFY
jgi:hypothetical protein